MGQLCDSTGEGAVLDGDQATAPPTPEGLVAKTIADLREAKGTDIQLLDILATSVLKVNQGDSAVADALASIRTLAAKRAEVSNDG